MPLALRLEIMQRERGVAGSRRDDRVGIRFPSIDSGILRLRGEELEGEFGGVRNFELNPPVITPDVHGLQGAGIVP